MLLGASPYDDYIFGGDLDGDFASVAIIAAPTYTSKWHKQAKRWVQKRGGNVTYARAGEPSRAVKAYIPPIEGTEIVAAADQAIIGKMFISALDWAEVGFLDPQGPQRYDTFDCPEFSGIIEHAVPAYHEGLPVRYELVWQGAPYSRV